MRILAICGSLQANSSNLTLLRLAAARAPEGVEVVIYDGLGTLPHFNPDLEASAPLPEVQALRGALAGSDALLIACPEYGHSLPGALKNAIDWVIGSGELERKVVARDELRKATARVRDAQERLAKGRLPIDTGRVEVLHRVPREDRSQREASAAARAARLRDDDLLIEAIHDLPLGVRQDLDAAIRPGGDAGGRTRLGFGVRVLVTGGRRTARGRQERGDREKR